MDYGEMILLVFLCVFLSAQSYLQNGHMTQK